MIIYFLLIVNIYGYVNDKLNECNHQQLCESMPLQFNSELHFTLHSHFDPYKLASFEQNQKGLDPMHKQACTDCIFNGIIDSLIEFPMATCIIADIAFFKTWYDSYNNQSIVKQLIQRKQLDIVNGGWVQNDQSTSNYQDIILQMSLGHQWLYNVFNITPTVAFNIDTYGHSNSHTGLMYLFGMKSQIIERVEVPDVLQRVKSKSLEFIWHSGPNNYQIFTHLRFKRHGSQLHHTSALAQLKTSGDGFCVQVYNQLKEFEQQLIYQKQGSVTDILFHYGGDTFQHLNASTFEAQNLIVQFYNVFRCRTLKVIWSGPSQYMQLIKTKIPSNITHKYSDFLPYVEDGMYWTAFYTTYPQFKYQIRQASLELDILSMYSVQNQLNIILHPLREQIALAQHYEGITGTAKYSILEDIQKNIEQVLGNIKLKLNQPLPLDLIGQNKVNNKQNKKRILIDCSVDKKCVHEYFLKNRRGESAIILIYNHQHAQIKTFELMIPAKKVQILTSKGQQIQQQEIRCYLNDDCFIIFQTFCQGYAEEQFILNFQCEQCAPFNNFKLHLDLTDSIQKLENDFEQGLPIEPFNWNETIEDIELNIEREGIDYEFHFKFNESQFSLSFNYYPNQKGKLFTNSQKKSYNAQAGKYVMLNEYQNGGLICEFEKMYILEQPSNFREILLQCGKVYQISLFFLPIGVEIRTDFNSSGLQGGDYTMQVYYNGIKENSQFFTDSNGWHMMHRQNNVREDYDPVYNESDIMNGNVYPMTSYSILQSDQQVSILTDRAQGVFSIQPSTIEIVLEHYGGDDGQGSGEACSKKVNNHYRHLLLFNESCIRCVWNEWQYRNKNMRLTDQFIERIYDQTIGDRTFRIQLQHLHKKNYLLYVENMQEVYPISQIHQYRDNQPQQCIPFQQQIIEGILQNQFSLVSAYLSGVPNGEEVDLCLKPMEIKAFILQINEQQ